jgi:hypothetical protein
MKWISVDDRLPENEERVLIWWLRADEDKQFRPVPSSSFGKYYKWNKQWRPIGCMGNFNDQITHWQPLPPPP